MIYFIVNKTSGSGNGNRVWEQVKKILDEKGLTYRVLFTEYKGHASEIAAELSEEDSAGKNSQREDTSGKVSPEENQPGAAGTQKYPGSEKCVVILGGDGTVNEFINGIRDFERIRLGVIPTGSGNDFVNGLGLPVEPEEALNRILGYSDDAMKGHAGREIDLGQLSYDDKQRYFAISSGIGLDAIVCKKALDSRLKDILNRLHLGKLTYLLLTVQTLFTMKTAKVSLAFSDGKKKRLHKMIFTAAMNLPAEGGGVPMAPNAAANDGKLSLCVAAQVPGWKTFFLLPFLVLAKHEKLCGFYMKDFRACQIRTDTPMAVHADGEYMGTLQNLCYHCVPEKLKLMV